MDEYLPYTIKNVLASVCSPWDIFISVCFAFFFYFIFKIWAKSKIQDSEIRRIFLLGFLIKIGITLISSFILKYYFRGGDALLYYAGGKQIMSGSIASILDAYSHLYMKDWMIGTQTLLYEDPYSYFGGTSNCIAGKLSGILSIFTFGSYTATGLWVSAFAYIGTWCIFLVASTLIPASKKYLAYGVLCIPTVLFWSSGVLKDAFCMGFLGLLFYGLYRTLILKKGILHWSLLAFISFIFIFWMKPYIAIAFVVAMLPWLVMENLKFVQSRVLKLAVFILILAFIFPFAYTKYDELTNVENAALSRLNPQKALDAALTISESTEGKAAGSAVDFGKLNPTPMGILTFIPVALGAILIRPFLWEASNALMLMNVMEGMFVIYMLLMLWKKIGIFTFFHKILNNSFLLSCFLFVVIFSFMVTASTNNYGSLVRYKIPCIPFAALILVYFYSNLSKLKLSNK